MLSFEAVSHSIYIPAENRDVGVARRLQPPVAERDRTVIIQPEVPAEEVADG